MTVTEASGKQAAGGVGATRNPALTLVMLGAWTVIVAALLWQGPNGKDGILYADPGLLGNPRPELAVRYLHVYLIAGVGRLVHDLALGAGLWALAVYAMGVGLAAWLGGAKGSLAALMSGLLMATCPLFLDMATVPVADMPSAIFALGALTCLALAVDHHLRWAALAGISLLVAARSKETALCIVPALVAIVLPLPPARRWRLLAALAVGFLAALAASVVLDALVLGDPAWSIRPRSTASYVSFNLKPQPSGIHQGTLVEYLFDPWTLAYALLAFVGMATHSSHPLGAALVVWSVTSALFFSGAVSVATFGANERYAIPIVLPLVPLAGIWLAERIRETVELARDHRRRRETLAVIAAIFVALASGQALAPHFIRRAFAQVLPVLWVIAVTNFVGTSLSRRLRPILGALILVLLAASTTASIYSARQMAVHAGRRNVQWMRLASMLGPARAEEIGFATSSDFFDEIALRTHSGTTSWNLRRITTKSEGLPRLIVADPLRSGELSPRGYDVVASFDPLPLLLLSEREGHGLERPTLPRR